MAFINKKIYCDAASTTPLDSKVVIAMKKVEKFWVNPSSIYSSGIEVKKVLEEARANVARALSVRAGEIIFTSGGTESNNLAIGGFLKNLALSGTSFSKIHIITSQIEHSSILGIFRHFEQMGVSVTYLSPNESGTVSAELLRKAIRKETVLVSIMYANNEIGTIQEIGKYGRIIKEERVRREKSGEVVPITFHTDASQAPLFLSIHVEKLGVDMMTLDAHKIYGPKGVGALFVKHNIKLEPIILGGGQERGLRSTTENVSGIVGFAEALRLADAGREKLVPKMKSLQNLFLDLLKKEIPQSIVNGDQDRRLPNNINISIPNIDPEFTVIKLDRYGVLCSTKSSCIKDEEESYVVKALGRTPSLAKETLRFTFLKNINKSEVRRIILALKRAIA